MKKLLAIVLALAMLCGMALAEGGDATGNDTFPLEFPEQGFTLHFPVEFQNLKGSLIPMSGLELSPGVVLTMMSYLGMSAEDANALKEAGDDEAYSNAVGKAIMPLFVLMSFEGDQDINAFLQSSGGSMDEVKELAKVGDFAFYSVASSSDQDAQGLEPDFQEEYKKLSGAMDDILANGDYYEPINVYADTENKALSFETTDMDGNAISSAELFAQHEYTLVNIWASWCGPCINELEELQAINGRLGDVDCGVIGLLYDGNAEKPRETARAILGEKGVTYTVILPPENVAELFVVQAFPTTYIVNRQGVIVGEPIVGARVEQYEPAIMALLGK